MTLNDIQNLYAYNAWANHQVMTSLQNLSLELFNRDLKSSHCSIRGTLVHLISAQWIWLQRWKGNSPNKMLPEEQFPTLEIAMDRWKEIDQDLNDYVCHLREADLDKVFTYRSTEGKTYSQPLWQALQHLVNHSSYHRGQLASLLRQVGKTPQATDLIRYYHLKAASA